MKVDLHVHSTCSDGTVTPEGLVKLALRENVKVLALCDHDTTDGIEPLMAAAAGTELKAVSGVELSVSWSIGTCHILGLDIDWKNKELQSVLSSFRNGRDKRNIEIVDNLQCCGIDITMDDVIQCSGGEVVGRPHIAKALVQLKVVSSNQEAFDQYLKKGAKAYVPRQLLDPMTALLTLKNANAITVLAHPVQLNIKDDQLRMFLEQLMTFGLDAIEVFTPHHTHEQVVYFNELAKDMGLGISGGSDYHGRLKPERQPGMYGKLKPIPDSVIDILEKKGSLYD
jgi:predicted metal-dependent phosphoesterase TrpH